jgi:hypothetical protein
MCENDHLKIAVKKKVKKTNRNEDLWRKMTVFHCIMASTPKEGGSPGSRIDRGFVYGKRRERDLNPTGKQPQSRVYCRRQLG